MKRILFVCTGNTCRSPMAEGIFRKIANPEKYIIQSAGIMTSAGLSASLESIEVCKEIDIDISSHKSKSITDIEDLSKIDLFIVMTTNHSQILQELNVPQNKIIILGNGIPDPYMLGIEKYRIVRDLILNELNDLHKKLEMI